MITTKHKVEFLKALDEGDYYEAHEVIEKIWFEKRFENSNEVKLLKGFINAAVSFELVKRGRKNPSKIAWRNYLKYRQLLFKTDSKQLQLYYEISQNIDKINKELFN